FLQSYLKLFTLFYYLHNYGIRGSNVWDDHKKHLFCGDIYFVSKPNHRAFLTLFKYPGQNGCPIWNIGSVPRICISFFNKEIWIEKKHIIKKPKHNNTPALPKPAIKPGR